MVLSRLLLPPSTTARLAAVATTRRGLLAQRCWLTSTASQSHLIVNAVGKDRLGIVSDISKHVTDLGGNVGESQASKLGHYFSMMMLIDLPTDQKDKLESQLQSLEGMTTTVFETEVSESDFTPQIAYTGYFEVEGANYPGIVHHVTTFLAHNGLSVDRLETTDEIAPHGGTTLFKMKGIACAMEPLSHNFDIEAIKTSLTQLGNDLNCDITLQDVPNPQKIMEFMQA